MASIVARFNEPNIPHKSDDNENFTTVLQIVTWFVITTIVLTVGIRSLIKYNAIRRFELDDRLLAPALVFGVGQSVTVYIQNLHGFGRHTASLSGLDIANALKAQYAANMLFIVCLCFCKLSSVAFMYKLSPRHEHRIASLVTGGIAFFWGVGSIIGGGVQCVSPGVWDWYHGRCYNRIAFWDVSYAINIFTEVLLMVLPMVIVLSLKMKLRRRLSVAFVFFVCRLSLITAMIVQAVYWNRYGNSSDPFFDLWQYVLTTQVVICLSILCACFSQFKQLMQHLNTGMLALDDMRRRGQEGMYGYTGINLPTRTGLSRSTRFSGAASATPNLSTQPKRLEGDTPESQQESASNPRTPVSPTFALSTSTSHPTNGIIPGGREILVNTNIDVRHDDQSGHSDRGDEITCVKEMV